MYNILIVNKWMIILFEFSKFGTWVGDMFMVRRIDTETMLPKYEEHTINFI